MHLTGTQKGVMPLSHIPQSHSLGSSSSRNHGELGIESLEADHNWFKDQPYDNHGHCPESNLPLIERKIEETDSQGLASSLCQKDVFSEVTHWNPDFDQEAFIENDMTSYIQQGKHDEIRDMIRNGYSINQPDENDNLPLVTAINFGTLETVLLLLQLGANPNAITFKSPPSILCDHVLRQADKIPQIVLLLSYGADPFKNSSYEFNSAIHEQRLRNLLVYFYWKKMYSKDHLSLPPKPNSVSELNNLVLALPLLTISGIMSLFHENLFSLATPIKLPFLEKILKEFFDFITN